MDIHEAGSAGKPLADIALELNEKVDKYIALSAYQRERDYSGETGVASDLQPEIDDLDADIDRLSDEYEKMKG